MLIFTNEIVEIDTFNSTQVTPEITGTNVLEACRDELAENTNGLELLTDLGIENVPAGLLRQTFKPFTPMISSLL